MSFEKGEVMNQNVDPSVIKGMIEFLRSKEVVINSPYDFQNLIEDHCSHSQLFECGVFESDNPLEDGPFGTKRIVTKSGSVFFRNSNGIFDPKTGKKRFASMAEFRRFEAHEHNLLGD
jgi:hypothetical protein